MTWLNNATVTTAQDKAAEAAEQTRQAAKAARQVALDSITYETADGDFIQCREQDEIRLRRKLERMTENGESTTPWIAEDNRLVMITADDIRGALRHGEDEVARIFEQYMSILS